MHELSIIHSIIEAAAGEIAQRGNRHAIESISLKIGNLAGVETDSIEFLWSAAVENTVLENAALSINHVQGSGRCTQCATPFPLEQYYDPCPACGSHLIEIQSGEELQIEHLTLVETLHTAFRT